MPTKKVSDSSSPAARRCGGLPRMRTGATGGVMRRRLSGRRWKSSTASTGAAISKL
jgi:hypothetical protein